MTPLQRQATKEINTLVEECEGNWDDIRHAVLETTGILFHHGTPGAKAYAHVLAQVYEEMEPKRKR